jgi:hypothetical protein
MEEQMKRQPKLCILSLTPPSRSRQKAYCHRRRRSLMLRGPTYKQAFEVSLETAKSICNHGHTA